jgi:hypothetical protein
LHPAIRGAYRVLYQVAQLVGKCLTELTDSEAHRWRKGNGIPDEAGELADRKLPDFSKFTRYLSTARNKLTENRYTRRAGRPSGKSIMRQRDIEPQKPDGE